MAMINKTMGVFTLMCFFVFCSGCQQKKMMENKFPSGKISEKYFLSNNMFHGKYQAYYENGQLRADGSYSKNLMIGEWHYYYPNGKLLTIQTFKSGLLTNIDAWDEWSVQKMKQGTGSFMLYYPSGAKMSQVTYKNCKQDGTWLSWFENGVVSSEIYYRDGTPVGIWKFWTEDGSLIKTENKDNPSN